MKRLLPLLLLLFSVAPALAAPLSFIEDDYARAVSEARQRKVPLFVDTWAPWCHTCRFMRAYVFNDAALGKQAKRFVWLSIDTEKDKNAAFLAKYPVQVWPTLMVVDAQRETAVLRWPGSATVPQLVRLLDDGERAVDAARGEKSGLQALANADRLAGEGKQKEAAEAYRAALSQVPADRRPRTIESLMLTLQIAHQDGACTESALELVPEMPRGPSFANAVSIGLGCAEALQPGELRTKARGRLEPLANEAIKLPGLLADDRSGLYDLLVSAREDAHDQAGKVELARRWLAFLEGEAAKAKTTEERAAFDPHRVLAAIAAGELNRVVAALQQSERDLPGDYNPPARLAMVYGELKRYDDALAAADRALAKVYGPRKLRVLDTKAGILVKKGDFAAARRTLEEALHVARSLPAAQHPEQLASRLQSKLDTLGK